MIKELFIIITICFIGILVVLLLGGKNGKDGNGKNGNNFGKSGKPAPNPRPVIPSIGYEIQDTMCVKVNKTPNGKTVFSNPMDCLQKNCSMSKQDCQNSDQNYNNEMACIQWNNPPGACDMLRNSFNDPGCGEGSCCKYYKYLYDNNSTLNCNHNDPVGPGQPTNKTCGEQLNDLINSGIGSCSKYKGSYDNNTPFSNINVKKCYNDSTLNFYKGYTGENVSVNDCIDAELDVPPCLSLQTESCNRTNPNNKQ